MSCTPAGTLCCPRCSGIWPHKGSSARVPPPYPTPARTLPRCLLPASLIPVCLLSVQKSGGTQLKLIMTFPNYGQALFKPMK